MCFAEQVFRNKEIDMPSQWIVSHDVSNTCVKTKPFYIICTCMSLNHFSHEESQFVIMNIVTLQYCFLLLDLQANVN